MSLQRRPEGISDSGCHQRLRVSVDASDRPQEVETEPVF